MLNPRIEKSRQAALDLLKPSQKDLEHGLELHANSLVIESYGLAPRAGLDGDALKAAVDRSPQRELPPERRAHQVPQTLNEKAHTLGLELLAPKRMRHAQLARSAAQSPANRIELQPTLPPHCPEHMGPNEIRERKAAPPGSGSAPAPATQPAPQDSSARAPSRAE